jgi:hypothetical protein
MVDVLVDTEQFMENALAESEHAQIGLVCMPRQIASIFVVLIKSRCGQLFDGRKLQYV